MAQPYKRVITQPDVPAVRDEFEGPFERVADAVIETIRANNAGGKLIGLEGQWGGGKSTVLRRVFEALRKDKNYRVVMFDAWAHQGDPLRRSFLERIIDEFETPSPWVSVDRDPLTELTRWETVREQLASRLSEERTITVPEPNALGLSLGVSALLVPAGVAVLAAALQEKSPVFDLLGQTGALALGLALSFAPLFVFLTIMILKAIFRIIIRSWNKASAWRHGNTTVNIWPPLRAADFSPLQNNAISTSTGKTIRTAEPTSLEFEKEFSELVKEALANNKKRRLVIAVDNLDRVDAKDALTIWSTLQTFVQERSGDGFVHFERVTFIVPYDPDGLARLWNQTSTLGESEPEGELGPAPNARIAQSFIDKSFSIKFEVPPPVMSDWRKYLAGKLADALPDHTQAERDSVVTVFDLWRSISDDAITPRKLKLLVNQVCAFCRQWPTLRDAAVGEFALSSIAYYALLRRSSDYRDVARNLLPSKKRLPHESIKHEIGERVVQDLAGLAHNVEGQHGVQLVIGEEVHNAFFAGNDTMFRDLEQQFGEGFWANLAGTTTRDLHTADAKSVCTAAYGLHRVGWFDGQPTQRARQLRDRVCSRFKACKVLDGITDESIDELLAVISLQPDTDIVDTAIQIWQATLRANQSDVEESDAKSRVSLTLRLMRELAGHGHECAVVTPFDLNVGASEWVSATVQLKCETGDGQRWKLFKPDGNTGVNEVAKVITQAVIDGTVGQSHRDCLQVTSTVFEDAT